MSSAARATAGCGFDCFVRGHVTAPLKPGVGLPTGAEASWRVNWERDRDRDRDRDRTRAGVGRIP